MYTNKALLQNETNITSLLHFSSKFATLICSSHLHYVVQMRFFNRIKIIQDINSNIDKLYQSSLSPFESFGDLNMYRYVEYT